MDLNYHPLPRGIDASLCHLARMAVATGTHPTTDWLHALDAFH